MLNAKCLVSPALEPLLIVYTYVLLLAAGHSTDEFRIFLNFNKPIPNDLGLLVPERRVFD